MILYRSVGLQELGLIYDSGMKAFPARLPQQPIFYPVLQLAYARQIASDWNVKSGQFAGYVTQFRVDDDYIGRFEEHTVGGSEHRELWIPAEEVEEFNRHIIGHIQVMEAYFGKKFKGFVPDQHGLQGKDAIAQFTMLANIYVYKRMEFYLEIKRNHKAVFLNYPFWQKYESKNEGLKEKMLQAIRDVWLTSFPKTPLPVIVQEDVLPEKQTTSKMPEKPVREETEPTPIEPKNTNQPIKPVDKDILAPKKEDKTYLVKPANNENPPVKKPFSFLRGNSPREDLLSPRDADLPDSPKDDNGNTPSVKKTGSHALGRPIPENIRGAQQTESHLVQGIKLGLSGRYQEAIEELSQAIGSEPDEAVAQTSLGVAFHRLGQEERALACYDAAIKADPQSAEARYFRANILYARGDVPEAIEEYTIAVGLNPGLVEAHQPPIPQDRLTDYTGTLAEIHRIARPARRILHLNDAIASNPRDAKLFKERAAEYSRLGNYEKAVADYDSSLAIQPEDANALHFRGMAYEQMGQPDRAFKDYQQAISLDPGLSDVFIDRGVEFGRMGNFRQSIASLTDGIRLAPRNPNGYFNRGATYVQLGDFERAIQDFSMVIQLASNDDAAYYWRGISHEEAGHQSEAIADYRQFLRLSQNPNARAEVEQKLERWTAVKQESVSDQMVQPRENPKTNPVPEQEPEERFDLYDLIAVLGERALKSTWIGSDVECYGDNAEELYAFTDQNKPIGGSDLLRITTGIRRTIEGDFQAFEPGANSYWIFIRAWEGSGFYVETNDPEIHRRLKADFKFVEEVQNVPPPYEGLFLHI